MGEISEREADQVALEVAPNSAKIMAQIRKAIDEDIEKSLRLDLFRQARGQGTKNSSDK